MPEFTPASVIEWRADMKVGPELQKDVPPVTLEEFKTAGAIACETPIRFGNALTHLVTMPYSVRERFTTENGAPRMGRGTSLAVLAGGLLTGRKRLFDDLWGVGGRKLDSDSGVNEAPV